MENRLYLPEKFMADRKLDELQAWGYKLFYIVPEITNFTSKQMLHLYIKNYGKN